MTEFFKALRDFKPSPRNDNFYIEVVDAEILSLCRETNNNTIKITQENYKFLLDNGISNFIYNGSIEKKPKKVITPEEKIQALGVVPFVLRKSFPFCFWYIY